MQKYFEEQLKTAKLIDFNNQPVLVKERRIFGDDWEVDDYVLFCLLINKNSSDGWLTFLFKTLSQKDFKKLETNYRYVRTVNNPPLYYFIPLLEEI